MDADRLAFLVVDNVDLGQPHQKKGTPKPPR
jgi:hypothetical protein